MKVERLGLKTYTQEVKTPQGTRIRVRLGPYADRAEAEKMLARVRKAGLGGAVLTESIFAWPGLGQLTIAAISQRDLPLIQGIVLLFALIFTGVNLIVDLLYGFINPTIRYK